MCQDQREQLDVLPRRRSVWNQEGLTQGGEPTCWAGCAGEPGYLILLRGGEREGRRGDSALGVRWTRQVEMVSGRQQRIKGERASLTCGPLSWTPTYKTHGPEIQTGVRRIRTVSCAGL